MGRGGNHLRLMLADEGEVVGWRRVRIVLGLALAGEGGIEVVVAPAHTNIYEKNISIFLKENEKKTECVREVIANTSGTYQAGPSLQGFPLCYASPNPSNRRPTSSLEGGAARRKGRAVSARQLATSGQLGPRLQHFCHT